VSKLQALGWQPKISLKQGIERTYAWYVKEEVPKMPKVSEVPKVKRIRANRAETK
jgi:dTDP-D-glucose 4,6-dehydratase